MKNFCLATNYGKINVVTDKGGGHVDSTLRQRGITKDVRLFNTCVDVMERVALAHACAGVAISDTKYIEGINTVLDALSNDIFT